MSAAPWPNLEQKQSPQGSGLGPGPGSFRGEGTVGLGGRNMGVHPAVSAPWRVVSSLGFVSEQEQPRPVGLLWELSELTQAFHMVQESRHCSAGALRSPSIHGELVWKGLPRTSFPPCALTPAWAVGRLRKSGLMAFERRAGKSPGVSVTETATEAELCLPSGSPGFLLYLPISSPH